MYKLCVFDLDGTLVNTIRDIANAVNRSLESLGFPAHSEAEFLQMVGDGMRVLCERALPPDKKEYAGELTRRYAALYIENCCVDGKRVHPARAPDHMSASAGYAALNEENP